MIKTKVLSLQNVLLIITTLIVILVALRRLFLGVEITDEAFYIAEARLIAQGIVPFVTGWFQASGAAWLYSWLVSLYEYLNGSTEGIFIFMRLAFLGFKLICLTITFFLLRRFINPKLLLLFLLTLIPFAPNNIFMLSYNTMPFFLILISQALIIPVLMNDTGDKSVRFSMAAGVLMALASLAHIQVTVIAILFGCFVLFVPRDSLIKKETIAYIIGFFVVFVLAVCALSIAGGGLGNLIGGIRTIMIDSVLSDIPRVTMEDNIGFLSNAFNSHRVFIVIIVIYFIIGIIYSFREKRERLYPLNNKKIVITSLLMITIIYVIILTMRFEPVSRANYSVVCALFFLPLAILPYLPFEKRKSGIVLLLVVWVPCLLLLITSAALVWSGLSGRFYLLFIGAMSSILFFTLVLMNDVKKGQAVEKIGRTGLVILAVALVVSVSIQQYIYVYRDAQYDQLKYRVEKGVYKGMFTTDERALGIVELENEIRIITSPEDAVLFLDNVPMAYLMSDASFITPTSWDIMNYSYGFTDDSIIQKFFNTVGKTPNKIIYIFTGRDDILSIEDESYVFNRFVFDNYSLTYENPDILFRIKMYEKKE